MRKIALVFVVLLALYAPWRLIVLGVESCFLTPGYVRTESGHDHYWEAKNLAMRLEQLGWTVTYQANLVEEHGALGLTRFSDRTITIEDTLSWNERYSILAHEGAHTLQPVRMTGGQKEVFAEAVSLLVMQNGYREHARYLSSMRADVFTVLLTEWPAIYRTATMLRE